jgi:hypothetical protein
VDGDFFYDDAQRSVYKGHIKVAYTLACTFGGSNLAKKMADTILFTDTIYCIKIKYPNIRYIEGGGFYENFRKF